MLWVSYTHTHTLFLRAAEFDMWACSLLLGQVSCRWNFFQASGQAWVIPHFFRQQQAGWVSGQTQFTDRDQFTMRKVRVRIRKTCICSLREASSQVSLKIILISERPDKTSFRSLRLGDSGWEVTREMHDPSLFAIPACLGNQPENVCPLSLWALPVGFKLNLSAYTGLCVAVYRPTFQKLKTSEAEPSHMSGHNLKHGRNYIGPLHSWVHFQDFNQMWNGSSGWGGRPGYIYSKLMWTSCHMIKQYRIATTGVVLHFKKYRDKFK